MTIKCDVCHTIMGDNYYGPFYAVSSPPPGLIPDEEIRENGITLCHKCLPMMDFMITSTDSFLGNHIERYLGLVHGYSIVKVKEVAPKIPFRPRPGMKYIIDPEAANPYRASKSKFEKDFETARHFALIEAQIQAIVKGANGIIGMDIDISPVDDVRTFMISVTGTAVELRKVQTFSQHARILPSTIPKEFKPNPIYFENQQQEISSQSQPQSANTILQQSPQPSSAQLKRGDEDSMKMFATSVKKLTNTEKENLERRDIEGVSLFEDKNKTK